MDKHVWSTLRRRWTPFVGRVGIGREGERTFPGGENAEKIWKKNGWGRLLKLIDKAIDKEDKEDKKDMERFYWWKRVVAIEKVGR